MRLYLSSFGLGRRPESLAHLVGAGRRSVVVLNALDHRDDVRARFRADQTVQLSRLGFAVTELDLRDFFGKASGPEQALRQADLVWINGGNTFILRRAMRQSGFDTVVRGLLDEDILVYGGFSAAVVIAGPDLRGLDLVDDPHEVPPSYDAEPVWQGLGLMDFRVAVHYRSDHPESESVEREVAYFETHDLAYRTLRDGEVLVGHGGRIDLAR